MQENGDFFAIFSLEDGAGIAASSKPVTGEKDTRITFGVMNIEIYAGCALALSNTIVPSRTPSSFANELVHLEATVA